MLQNLKSLLMWSLSLTFHAGIGVFRCLGRMCINRGQHLPIERVTHEPQHSHIRPGYRYSSVSLQSSCEKILQDTSRQSSLPQGADRHRCAAMCITAMVSKQNTTCTNGIRHDQLFTMWKSYLIMLGFYLTGYPNSLTPFNSKTALIWRFNVDGNCRTWNRLQVKCPIVGVFGDYWQFFIKVAKMKFHVSPFSGSCADTCWPRYGWLIIKLSTFHVYANMPNKLDNETCAFLGYDTPSR